MNCKPGDLAYIIRSAAGNEGVIVEVIKPAYMHEEHGQVWLVRASKKLISSEGWVGREQHVPDAWLRPISGLPVHAEQRDEVPA